MICPLCGQDIVHGQIISGVREEDAPPLDDQGMRVSDTGYYEGHYTCVVKALGPEKTLQAIQSGRLPALSSPSS